MTKMDISEEKIELELLTEANLDAVREIRREDISEDWVDTVDTLMEYTLEGIQRGCMGHTYAIRYEGKYVGIILLGEAILWETDPPEMKSTPFYRLMGFVLDRRYRGHGLGGMALELVIGRIYAEFGPRPIACGVHADNVRAARFYEKHGFVKTQSMDDDDIYYLRRKEYQWTTQRRFA